MKKLIILAAAFATLAPAAPALADPPHREYRKEVREAQRDYRKNVREARRDYDRDVRDARKDRRRDTRNWRNYRNYDWNRVERGERKYYADRYYRDGQYYQPRRLSYNDRVYRGSNGRYYCRRNDGTTGLLIGGAAGGLLGNTIAPGGSKTLGALIGAGAGALLGREIDRGDVRCR